MPAHVSAAAARETRKMQDTTVHNTCMRSCALATWPQHAEHAPHMQCQKIKVRQILKQILVDT